MRLIIEARLEGGETSETEATIVAVVERKDQSVADLGLTLAEGRALLAEVQSLQVSGQTAGWTESQLACDRCGLMLAHKVLRCANSANRCINCANKCTNSANTGGVGVSREPPNGTGLPTSIVVPCCLHAALAAQVPSQGCRRVHCSIWQLGQAIPASSEVR